MGDLKDIDAGNIRRPRDGDVKLFDASPFASTQSTKLEVFNALDQEIQKANNQGTKILDSSVNQFLLAIEGRETNPKELLKAVETTEKLIASAPLLSNYAQEVLVTIPGRIANHRNANYDVSSRGKDLFEQLSDKLTSLTSEKAQQTWFSSVNSIDLSKNRHNFRVTLLKHIDQSAPSGIDSIQEKARDYFIQFVGNTAHNLLQASKDNQAAFQTAAIRMLQKSQFPYKFDASAFREALFVVPEIVQLPEYKKQLQDYEDQLTAEATA